MKRLSKIADRIVWLVVLLALFAVLMFTINSKLEQEKLSLVAAPISPYPPPASVIRSLPYPGPDATSNLVGPTIFPTVTLAPKPTGVAGITPTTSAHYQTLPLPPSSFWAVWIENIWENKGGILWASDPGDLSKQREVFSTKFGQITNAAVSSDGQKLAVVTSDSITSVLWVMNLDGSDQKQIVQANAIGGLTWSRDDLSLAYIASRNNTEQSRKNRGEIVLQELASGEKKLLVEFELDVVLNVLGWSNDGGQLFYSLAKPIEVGYGYELWAVDAKGENSWQVTSLESETVSLLLSPEGKKFLLSDSDGLSLFTLSDGKTKKLTNSVLKDSYQAIWGISDSELVVRRVDASRSIVYIDSYNLDSGATKEVGRFEPSPNGYGLRLLSISPDLVWTTVSESTGTYFVHVPSGEKVSFPYSDRQIIFVTWISNSDK